MTKIKGIVNFYALLSLGCYRAFYRWHTKLSRRGYDVRVSQLCLSGDEKSLPETAESLFPAKDVTHRKSSQSKSAILEQIFYSVDETRSIIVIVLRLSSEMGIFSNSSTFDGLVGKLLLPCILYKVEITELKILSQKHSNIISLARVFHNARVCLKHISQGINVSLKKAILFNSKEKISMNCWNHHHHFIKQVECNLTSKAYWRLMWWTCYNNTNTEMHILNFDHTAPSLYEQLCFLPPKTIRTMKELWDGVYGFPSLSQKTKMSGHLYENKDNTFSFCSVILRPWVLVWSKLFKHWMVLSIR